MALFKVDDSVITVFDNSSDNIDTHVTHVNVGVVRSVGVKENVKGLWIEWLISDNNMKVFKYD